MKDDRYLLEKVREAIRDEKLPIRTPDHLWGGPATGARCAVCGAITSRPELELEIEFTHGDDPSGSDRYFVHQRCYSLLELERQNAVSGPTPTSVGARTGPPNGRWD